MGGAASGWRRGLKPVPSPFISSAAASPIERTTKHNVPPRCACNAVAGSIPVSINWRHKARTGALPCTVMLSALQVSLPISSARIVAGLAAGRSLRLWSVLFTATFALAQRKSLNGSSDNWGRSFLFVDESQPDCFSARHEWNLIDVDDLEFVVAVMPPNRWAGEAGQRYPFIDAPAECLIERGCTTALPLFHDECMRALMTCPPLTCPPLTFALTHVSHPSFQVA
jgi:hypothetical protein